MKKLILINFLLVSIISYSQELSRTELDSLYTSYLKIKNPVTSETRPLTDSVFTKCGFSIVNSVRLNFDKFTAEQQQVLLKAFQRPSAQTEIGSAAGNFIIHYDTAGINALRYSLQDLVEAVDSSFNYEVHTLGYAPPRDFDEVYDIYVTNVGSLYGYTELEGRISSTENRFYSFMVIDNEYTHTASRGIEGARVTIAHELHHGIQIGSYTYNEQDIYFHELSSTAMEEFVFDDVNDYYFYMDDYFDAPEVSLPNHNGYDSAIWNIFLKDNFDLTILRTQWEKMREPGKRALDAIAQSIGDRSSSFQEIFNKFGIWIFFTGFRAIPGKYFEEAARYPVARSIAESDFTPPADTMTITAYPLTHNFITLSNNSLLESDTLTILISNSDYKTAIINPGSANTATYELYSDSSDGLTKLADGYFKRFTSQNNAFWTVSEFLNNQLVSEGFNRIESVDAFPMPFRYSLHSFIYFPVKVNPDNDVELYIYSPSMDLIYQSRKDIHLMFGENIVSWNGRTSENHKVGSGVYLYVIKSGDDYLKGKIVLFND